VVYQSRYHGLEDAPYMLPNDEEEVERLQDIQYCFHKFLGRNIVAPISLKPQIISLILEGVADIS
jgi:hypothetical protein